MMKNYNTNKNTPQNKTKDCTPASHQRRYRQEHNLEIKNYEKEEKMEFILVK